jgi:NADH-quinone oxidoreductase subunit G
VGGWSGARPGTPAAPAAEPAPRADSQLVVDSWKLLLDLGRMQDGEPHLAATARRPRASINAATAQQLGVDAGGELTISSDRGTVTLPVAVGDVADGVVWLPANSVGSRAYADLGVVAGSVVTVVAAGAAVAQPDTAEVAS